MRSFPVPLLVRLLPLAAAQPRMGHRLHPASEPIRGVLSQPIRGAGRFNFCGIRCRWSTSRVKHRQEPSRGLFHSFRRVLSWFLFHEVNHEGAFLKCPSNAVSRVSK